jgi:hypothetical protein
MTAKVRIDELPAAVRRKIAARARGTTATPDARAAQEAGTATDRPRGSGRPRWRCHACGELPKSWAAAERHADEMGHTRIELVLETMR